MPDLVPLYTTEELRHDPIQTNNDHGEREIITCPEKDNRTIAIVPVNDQEGKANLELIMSSPEMHELLGTVVNRLENLLQDKIVSGLPVIYNEIQDIQNIIWEFLNYDGNLRGIAKYKSDLENEKNNQQ